MSEHRKVLKKKRRLLTRRERNNNRKARAGNNTYKTSLVSFPGTQWPVQQTGVTCQMVDRKMACLDRGHLPEWWTEEMSVSQEMTAEGETDEGEICKQCQSKFWTEEMCTDCGRCTECCLDGEEDNLKEWRALHHFKDEEEEKGEMEPDEDELAEESNIDEMPEVVLCEQESVTALYENKLSE